MTEFWRRRVIDRLDRGESLEQIDQDLDQVKSMSDDERSALWLLAWGEQQRGKPASGPPAAGLEDRASATRLHRLPQRSQRHPIIAALELARSEIEMDVAVLGEACGGSEVVRFVAGDGSFGLAPGAAMPIEDTYCHRLLTGRISNVVPDALIDEQLKDLPITHAGRVGAYIGVPLTALDARLYVLCCLAHEQKPLLGERDVLFLRGLGEAIVAELEKRRTHAADGA
jgi:GAF domain-containing protein